MRINWVKKTPDIQVFSISFCHILFQEHLSLFCSGQAGRKQEIKLI